MLTSEEIKLLIDNGEGYNAEFKVSIPSKISELSQEICAFANSAGGYLIIGVDNDNRVIGVTIDNTKRSTIYNSIRDITPALFTEIYQVEVDSKSLWVIEVPSGKNKPYVLSGVIYVRQGPNTQKLTTADEIREFFEQSGRIHFDNASCPEFNYPEDIDDDTFREFCRKSNIGETVPREQIFRSLQLFDKDNQFKRGGVLFFAKHPENYYFQAVTRCVRFKGKDKTFIIDDKKYGGSVYKQYINASAWLQDKLAVSYIIEDMGPRKEVWELPLAALREGLANSICHREYYEMGANVMVEVYDDRVTITNPGGLLPMVAEHFGEMSMSRNPLVFGLFTRMQVVEQVGSGINRMRELMTELGLPEPVYKTHGMFSITFMRSEKDVLQIRDEVIELSQRQKTIIALMKENPNITIKDLRDNLQVSRDTIHRAINNLKVKGLITRIGPDKKGYWSVLLE